MTETVPKSRLPRTGTLLLIAVVLLIGGGGLMVWLPYHREQQAIAEIERLGGTTESAIFRPFWIPDAVNEKYLAMFEKVVTVNLSHTEIGDVGLEHLEWFTKLEYLTLNATPVSDAGLGNLRGLTDLRVLSLYDTQIGDAGLEHLRGLTSLQILTLLDTQVTQAGIAKLRKALPHCDIQWAPPAD